MKIFSPKDYSFSTKIGVIFLIFIFIFIIVRSILVIPKTEKKSFNQNIDYLSKSLNTTKEQLIIINRALQMQSFIEQILGKERISYEIEKLNIISKNFTKKELIKTLIQNKVINQCSYKITDGKFKYQNIKKNNLYSNDTLFEKNNHNIHNNWHHYRIPDISNNFLYNTYSFFNYHFQKQNLLLSIGCEQHNLNPHYGDAKKNLKEHIRKNLLIDSQLKSTQISFFRLNPKIDTQSDTILLEQDLEKQKNKYQVSDISTVPNIPTGNLSIKEVFNTLNKEPIEHIYNGKELITWIVDVSAQNNNEYFLLTYTIDKQELLDKNKRKVMFLLPETFLALFISFILIFFIFKNILKNMKVLDMQVTKKTEQLEKSLEEKEILLKEVHHRVKNNLALTISLIELQEEDIEDTKTKKILVDIQERIYTMELLHRKLYESENLNDILFKNYVSELTSAIAKTYDMDKKVNIDIQMEAMNLNIESAMPYGLILNELITNAFKYAFKEQEVYQLFIQIGKKNSDEIEIIIKDNGEGLKNNFSEICYETLGLKLINMIVKLQLHGTINYQYENGAKYIIDGKIKKVSLS